MAKFELKLPKMGESVAEATIISWLKEVGDPIATDEAIIEIATDKVDSEVPSEVNGVLVEKCYAVDAVVQVGETLAIIETKNNDETPDALISSEIITKVESPLKAAKSDLVSDNASEELRFYSPLVKNIAQQEGISLSELEHIPGTGKGGRVTKNDILHYMENSGEKVVAKDSEFIIPKADTVLETAPFHDTGDEIITMDRMRKLISNHMIQSLQTAAHVQSFVEADVTNLVKWRTKKKQEFEDRHNEKLTYTPVFIEIIARALRDFPMMNISVQGDKIIKKNHIHIGMATALPNGNLIVPVIKNADRLNLTGLAKQVNDLANKARNNKLAPDDIQGGTYTITNVGNFGSIMGTPIINQPQVGILALGVIRKVPAVIETPEGDFIGIRHKMFLSHSYDHRVIDGALGGMFAKRVASYLETWDMDTEL